MNFCSKCIPQRYLLCIECFLCMSVSYMMRFCLSLAMTEMTKATKINCPYPKNFNLSTQKSEFYWTSHQVGLIHASFFWGYFVTSVIGGILSDLFNHKIIMLCGLMATSACTAVTPIITRHWNWIGLIICRIFVGFSEGLFFNSLLANMARWIPPVERGTFGTFIFSGAHLGSSINFITTGYLIDKHDWPLPFYIYSGSGVFLATVFFFTTPYDPLESKHIFDRDSKLVEYLMDNVLDKARAPKQIPIKLIFKNKHVWALVIATFGHAWCYFFIIVFLPVYMKRVLHLTPFYNGIYNSVLYTAIFIQALVSGILSDLGQKKNVISLTWIRRIPFLIGSIFPALSFIGITYVECLTSLAMNIMIMGISTLGYHYSTITINALDLSANYAATICSVSQLVTCVAGIFIPYMYGMHVTNDDIMEWRVIFIISSMIILISGLVFVLFSSAEEQRFSVHQSNFLYRNSLTPEVVSYIQGSSTTDGPKK